MRRREMLRYGGSVLSTASLLAIAGCSDDSGGGADDGDDGDGESTTTESDGPVQEEMGEVVENEVSGLEIVGWESDASGSRFEVDVTIENTGERDTDLFDYNYAVNIYDEDGDKFPYNSTNRSAAETEIAAGEQGSITLSPRYGGDLSKVERYEISLTCPTLGPSAAYC